MAVFWITEALPIPVTALIPVFMFPIIGLLSVKEASQQYVNVSIPWVGLQSMIVTFPGLDVIKLEYSLRLKIKHNDGCLRVRKQPIIALYFESENELKFYNLEARSYSLNFVLLHVKADPRGHG